MPLSDSEVRSLKPKEKVYRRSVGESLYIEVHPEKIKKDGSKGGGYKYWVWFYTFPPGRNGRKSWYQIGRYGKRSEGLMTLTEARDEKRILDKLRREGEDPRALKSADKRGLNESGLLTFRRVADEWMGSNRSGWSPTTYSDNRNKLENQILPVFGNQLIKSITRQQCIAYKKSHEERGKKSHADKLFGVMRGIFTYAIDIHDLYPSIDYNPCRSSRQTQSGHKTSGLPSLENWDEVPTFLKDLSENKCGGEFTTNNAVKVLLLTFQRSESILGGEWSEIDWDKKMWTIPADRMKGRKGTSHDHLIPMSYPLIDVLKRQQALTGSSPYIFESARGKKTPYLVSESPNKHLKALGYHKRLVVHGFRSMAATHGQEILGIPYEYIALQLGHTKKDKVEKAYNRAKFIKQRTELMRKWGDLLVENGLQV
tara:strand:+ start:146 stop:1423 length:1278 start_codon:yes stop_codon:yes gene_type:complete